jgi:hypothetical protein
MRHLHGIENLAKQCDARTQIEPAIVNVTRDRQSFDVFHHQIRRAVRVLAGVEQARDIRMAQRTENALFQSEARAQVARVEQQQFDRHGFCERAICPLRAIDRAHAAGSDQRGEPIRAQLFADAIAAFGDRFGEEVAGALIGFDQRIDFGA